MYAKIAEISTTNYKNNVVAFQLFEQNGVEPSPMPKLPITGYRLRFKLSEFGFGILNTTLSLDILDDEQETYYNKFNAQKRLDYAVRVTIAEKEIFWGFINFKQIERKIFQDKPNEIKITCYNPLSYLSTVAVSDTDTFEVFGGFVVPGISNEGRITGGQKIMRIGRLLTNFAFGLFNSQPDFVVNQPYIPALPRTEGGTTIDWYIGLAEIEKNIINAGYFNFENFVNDDGGSETLLQMLTSVMRTLFMRCGWSFSQQKPMATATHDYDDYASEFLRFTATKPLGDDGGAISPAVIVNNVSEYNLVGTFVLEKNKFLRGATNKGVNPLAVIIYKQDSEILGAPSTAVNFTVDENKLILNVAGVDAIQGDTYESDSLAFVSSPDANLGLGDFFVPTGQTAPDAESDVPGQYDSLTDGFVIMEELLARIHESLRDVTRERLQFVYDGILDPMINYTTDFNDEVYIIEQGEYDLLLEQTVVRDSISINSIFSSFLRSILQEEQSFEAVSVVFVDELFTKKVFDKFAKANLICPMTAGAQNKLYFWVN